ncbi:MAG: MBOAT family protein, partial [Anaerolineae bacterium]|nr:MBOAT family protein [Anaerolineae bacterium]
MNITSLNFAGFLIVTLIMYYILPRRQQNWLLLVMSYAFYVTWSWFYAAMLAGLTLVNFALAGYIRKPTPDNYKGRPQVNRAVLWAGIGVNLAALAFFKYEDFFVPDLRAQLSEWSADTGLGTIDLLLPVGMSFYVVTVISYLLDISRGQADPPAGLNGLIDFGVYMAYFPKLLAGPIERARSFMPKLAEQRIVDNDVMSRSFALIVIGVVRKAVIADTLFRTFPADLWNKPASFSAFQLIGFLIVYGFALYNDFAGYTSVARGVSGLFGIELSRNFNLPYTARNLSEFWNRWHITLSNWLRDYVYYPASRALLRRNPSRTNMANAIFPPLLTMFVSGLWHGPGWTMVLWGMLHGVYLVGERLLA